MVLAKRAARQCHCQARPVSGITCGIDADINFNRHLNGQHVQLIYYCCKPNMQLSLHICILRFKEFAAFLLALWSGNIAGRLQAGLFSGTCGPRAM